MLRKLRAITFMRFALAVFCLLLSGCSATENATAQSTMHNLLALVNVPLLPVAPVIDGVLAPEEWSGASGSLIALAEGGETLTLPDAQFRIGRVGSTLYVACFSEKMATLPEAKITKRDGALWNDDSFELYFKTPSGNYHLIVNSAGVLYDSRNGEASWNGPWQVAAKTIGLASSVGEGSVKRGFAVEAALNLEAAGITVPADGDVWKLQVGFNLAGKNPHATWNSGAKMVDASGEMVWGGGAHRLESVSLSDGGRTISAVGRTALQTVLQAAPESQTVNKKILVAGAWGANLSMKGGARYQATVSNSKLRWSFFATAVSPVPVIAVLSPSRESFFVRIDPGKFEAGPVPLHLSIVRDNRVLWQYHYAPRAAGGRTDLWVPYRGWATGDYQLLVEANAGGTRHEAARIGLKAPVAPVWANYELPPNLPLVPKPFEPVRAREKSANVIGRTYRWNESPFLSQVSSAGSDILSAPVTLRGKVGGQPLSWTTTSWKLVEQARDKVAYEGSALASTLELKVRATLEYDGMLRLDWSVFGRDKKPVTVEDLQFVVPVKSEFAELYTHYVHEGFTFSDLSTWNGAGRLPESGWSGRFTPLFWLGNDKAGIQWFAEHRAGWTPRDPNKYLEVRRTTSGAELICHLADDARLLDKPLEFTFGLMASPVRPRPAKSDWNGSRLYVEGDWSWFVRNNEALPETRAPSIVIPAPRDGFGSQGSIEMEFRVDWDPQTTSSEQAFVQLMKPMWRFQQAAMSLRWSREEKALQVIGAGERLLFSMPVAWKKGEWHRVTWNFGPQMSVWVDGRKLGEASYDGALPQWDRNAQYLLGGSGNIALRRWRISRAPRNGVQISGAGVWAADQSTLHLATVDHDPTILNWLDPQVGGLSSPAYLNGEWKFDDAAKILVAGNSAPMMTRLEHFRKVFGARGAVWIGWSKGIEGHGGIWDEKKFAEINALAKKNDMKLLPYTPNGITSAQPEYSDYKWEFSEKDPSQEPAHWWTKNGVRLYSAPPVGAVRRFNLYQAEQILKGGAAGFYLDGYFYPPKSSNPLLGTEIIDPITGQAVPHFSIFAAREQMQDLTRLLQHYQPDGKIDAHASLGPTLPTMSHVTDYTNGESLAWWKEAWPQHLTPDVVVADYAGRQYGWNSDALLYPDTPVPQEYGIAMMGLQGQHPRVYWGLFPQRAQRIWELSDRFDTENAQWISHREAATPFRPDAKEVLASAWLHKGERVLLILANWSDETRETKINVDWKALGLAANARVHLLNTNETLRVHDGKISLQLKPRRLMYLWVGKETA